MQVGSPICLIAAQPHRGMYAHAQAQECCNVRTGHLGLWLGHKLSKLSLKDHCSRDPVQVQSGQTCMSGMARAREEEAAHLGSRCMLCLRPPCVSLRSDAQAHFLGTTLEVALCIGTGMGHCLAHVPLPISVHEVGTRVPQKFGDSH